MTAYDLPAPGIFQGIKIAKDQVSTVENEFRIKKREFSKELFDKA
jgi:hypothetical protein